ncbi:MAG: hypothetical protein KBG28_19175 [Kofleriaceae bacterium]|jgi:hypothetical protein|nr:hypothetical protein [Kofleriaceae bacterium]MBP6836391.1 hypothetical protein [Kofleriaceae bacterium]MBP9206104.1 hypothetical protein [Kofleriaceae bacterium]
MARKKAGWLRYVQEAFLYRWNLLIFGGAAAAAVLSGHADIALPLVAAGELTYLAGLTTIPRFQAAIDAKARAEERGLPGGGRSSEPESAQSSKDRVLDVLRGLAEERRNRFLRLRARCVEMQRIANAVRGETRDASGAAGELRAPALDRLLWVFLKLLLSQQALERFLRAADGAALRKALEDLRGKEAAASRGLGDKDVEDISADQSQVRIVRSLRDSIATAELRVDNFDKASRNAEFVAVELDRIEQKIHALTEMAISHQDPDSISAQVDAVAEGMSQTEATIRELQAITGVSDAEEAPSILDSDLVGATPER